jgi:hypothetical protein
LLWAAPFILVPAGQNSNSCNSPIFRLIFQKSLSIGRAIGQWFYCPPLFAAIFDAALHGCSVTPTKKTQPVVWACERPRRRP